MNSTALHTAAQLVPRILQPCLCRCAVLASLLAPILACDDSQARNPASPSPGATSYTLSGVVSERTPTGLVPVQGVQIRAEPSVRATTTDSRGFFELSGMSGQIRSLTAAKSGYATVRRSVDVSTDTRVDLELTTIESQVLSGTVFATTATGKAPVAGVSVYCDSCGSPDGHTDVTTAEDGAYAFSWAQNGPTPLLVRKDGYRPLTIVAIVDGNTRFDIELIPQ